MKNLIGISGKIGSGKDTIGKIIQWLVINKEFPEVSYNEFTIWTNTDLRGSKWEIKKFAYKLKQICSLLTGIPTEDFERQQVKDLRLGREWNSKPDVSKAGDLEAIEFGISKGFGVPERVNTVRWLLQTVGTEAMRNNLHPDVWVNALFADYKGIKGFYHNDSDSKLDYDINTFPNWIITDMRFPNELEAVIKRNGLTIRVNRFHPVDTDDIKYEHPSETALDDYKSWDYVINNDGTIEELIEQVKQILIKEQII